MGFYSKTTKALAIASIMAISPLYINSTYAQSGMVAVSQTPGTYKHVNASAVLDVAVSNLNEREKAQVSIIQEAIGNLEKSYLEILNKQVSVMKDAMTASTNVANGAITRGSDKYNQFYKAYDNYQHAKTAFNISLVNLKQMPASLASSNSLEVAGQKLEYPSYINQNAFDSLVANFESAIAGLENELNNYNIVIEYDSSGPEPVKFTELDEKRAKLFVGTDYVIKQTEKADFARARAGKQAKKITPFNQAVFSEIRSFIGNWGSSKSFRIKEFNADQFISDYRDIQNYFYMKSALRIMYRVPLGAFIVDHKIKKLNLDIFSGDLPELNFTNGGAPIHKVSDLKTAKDKAVNKLAIMKMRLKNVEGLNPQKSLQYGSQLASIFSGDGSIFERVLGASSIIKGDVPQLRVGVAVLELILQDIEEEISLNRFGGHQKVKIGHKARFGAVEDEVLKAQFSETKKFLVALYKNEVHRKLDTDSVEGTLSLVKGKLEIAKDLMAEANQIQEKVNRLKSLTDRGQSTEEVDLDF